jgi:hypothetical protein
MRLIEVNAGGAKFRGEAASVAELFASIEDGYFTLDGRNVTVVGNLSLDNRGLRSLIGCPLIVPGNFSCTHNALRTLEGAPQKVGGNFMCGKNELMTLKGAPDTVGGSFWCERNLLPTLEGGPRKVGGVYNCMHNELTSLLGCAETINGSLLAGSNKNLRSLKGGPRFVKYTVYLQRTALTSLENVHLHLPEVGLSFYIKEVPLQSHVLGLLKIKGLTHVDLDDAKLQAILNKYLPEGDFLACALELAEAGYEEYARL